MQAAIKMFSNLCFSTEQSYLGNLRNLTQVGEENVLLTGWLCIAYVVKAREKKYKFDQKCDV